MQPQRKRNLRKRFKKKKNEPTDFNINLNYNNVIIFKLLTINKLFYY